MQTKEELMQEIFNEFREAMIPVLRSMLDKGFKTNTPLNELSGTVLGKALAWSKWYFDLIVGEYVLNHQNPSQDEKTSLIKFIADVKEHLAVFEDIKLNSLLERANVLEEILKREKENELKFMQEKTMETIKTITAIEESKHTTQH